MWHLTQLSDGILVVSAAWRKGLSFGDLLGSGLGFVSYMTVAASPASVSHLTGSVVPRLPEVTSPTHLSVIVCRQVFRLLLAQKPLYLHPARFETRPVRSQRSKDAGVCGHEPVFHAIHDVPVTPRAPAGPVDHPQVPGISDHSHVGSCRVGGVGVSQVASMTAEGGHWVEGVRVAHLVVTGQTTFSGGILGALRLMFLRDDDSQEQENQ